MKTSHRLSAVSAAVFTFAFSMPGFSASKPLGNSKAPTGGVFRVHLPAEPAVMNPLSSNDGYTTEVNGHIIESLLDRHLETREFLPSLAEKYEVAKDGKSITFVLRQGIVFSDGKPVTVDDVKFSFDAIFDDKYKAVHLRSFYENFSGVEIVDAKTVKFLIKKPYFQNLDVAGGLSILPKHIYSDPKGNKVNKISVGSGPMMFEKYDQGKMLILKKNPKWWGWTAEYFKNSYKFDRLQFRFIQDENASLEMLKRGELDYSGLSAEQFFLKTEGAPFGASVIKEKVVNLRPKATPFVGWNLKNELFKDRDVRLALTHLFDRTSLAKKFFFDAAVPATGPWYQQNEAANPKTKAIAFDPSKARELLKKSGWIDSDKDGVLDKHIAGKKKDFRFTLLNPNKDYEKHFTVYREELKKSGIDMKIMNIEWSAFQKKIDEKDFEALFLVWSGSLDYDPKQIWHTSSQAKGGSNFISYSNPKVDALIDKAREELNDKKRIELMREVYDLIAQDVPYTFLVNLKHSFYARNKKMGQEVPTYKYGVGNTYWWINTN